MWKQWYLVYFEQYVDESAWMRSCGPNPANLNRLGPPMAAVDFKRTLRANRATNNLSENNLFVKPLS